jgi:hypothetical protein
MKGKVAVEILESVKTAVGRQAVLRKGARCGECC